MELQKINSKALTLAETLKTVATITTSEEYSKCGELWKAGKDMMKEIDEAYDSLIAAAYRSHKEAVTKKKSFYLPIEEATKYVKNIMSDYDEAQERIRLEAERKLREEAMRREEEARLQAAIEAEKAGQQEVADKIMDMPIVEPVVMMPKTTPKLQGGPVYQTRWNMEVENFEALVEAVANKSVSLNALLPNEVFLRAQARSLKNTMNFPGIKVFKQRT